MRRLATVRSGTQAVSAASRDGRHDEQASYDGLFARLAEGVRADGWEARQETPPQAYLHVSRPGWGDGGMDGIHIEAYGG